jgi:hypothetical protein
MRMQWVLQLSDCKIKEEVFHLFLIGHVNLTVLSVIILMLRIRLGRSSCLRSYQAPWRCHLEGCSNFKVVSDHDTLRHLLSQPSDRLNKQYARCVRNLQPFTGAVTLAYRKGSINQSNSLSRQVDFYTQANFPLFWDIDVPQSGNHRKQS